MTKKKLALAAEWAKRCAALKACQVLRRKADAIESNAYKRHPGRGLKMPVTLHCSLSVAYKFRADADKLIAEANILWNEAILDRFGNTTTMEWDTGGCRLGNGEFYKSLEQLS